MKKVIAIISALLLMSCASSREIIIEDYPEEDYLEEYSEEVTHNDDTTSRQVYIKEQILIEKEGVLYTLTGLRVRNLY